MVSQTYLLRSVQVAVTCNGLVGGIPEFAVRQVISRPLMKLRQIRGIVQILIAKVTAKRHAILGKWRVTLSAVISPLVYQLDLWLAL